jgi:hypothetical protein
MLDMMMSSLLPSSSVQVDDIFRVLLEAPIPVPTSSNLLPLKNAIRSIENDPHQRREKFDGNRWRLACTWNLHECTNLAYAYQLCTKHNAERKNKQRKYTKRTCLTTSASLPISTGKLFVQYVSTNFP